MIKFFQFAVLGVFTLVSAACEQANFAPLLSPSMPATVAAENLKEKSEGPYLSADLGAFTGGSRSKIDVDSGFEVAMIQALEQDPNVLVSKNQVVASKARLRLTKSGRDTQIKATVLGGVEDLTDETVGVAAVLSAKRIIYDGGVLSAKIDSDTFYSQAAEQAYLAVRGERALRLSHFWIELERYQVLMDLIDSRLAVLDPLVQQLEEVASAGVGDVSQVAGAQRVVSSILVAQMAVEEKYAQSKIAFVSEFGGLPKKSRYGATLVSNAVPTSTVKQISKKSPGVLSKYWAYKAAEATIVAVKAQGDFSIGFEAKLQQPFGGSGFSADESIGLALSKNFFRGDQLNSQVENAEAAALVSAAQVTFAYRLSERTILASREMIQSMDRAIQLARRNAKSSREEIDYLRKQLIIGGSTLESVLSAEARLYEAESKEIGFIAERQKAESTIVALSDGFSRILGSK